VLAALDLDGRIVWRHELADYQQFDVAVASSPVIVGDAVLLLCDRNGKASTLTAYDCRTGSIKWEQKRAGVAFAHSTPTLVKIAGRQQLLIAASNALQSLDPATGEVRWFCKLKGDVCSPVYADGLVYCDSGRGGPGAAVDPTGEGDVSATHVRWTVPQIPEGLSSPVIAGEHLFRLHQPGVLKVWRLKTGEEVLAKRLEGISTAASPIATPDGLIYIASAGKTHVLRAEPPFEPVSLNDLGESSAASMAVSRGRLFLKGSQHLFCVGSP
jgi:outer membrane protein assembly factor BamB